MKKVTCDGTWGLNYKDMKTLNEIDKIRRERTIKDSEKINKQFDNIIELLKAYSNNQ